MLTSSETQEWYWFHKGSPSSEQFTKEHLWRVYCANNNIKNVHQIPSSTKRSTLGTLEMGDEEKMGPYPGGKTRFLLSIHLFVFLFLHLQCSFFLWAILSRFCHLLPYHVPGLTYNVLVCVSGPVRDKLKPLWNHPTLVKGRKRLKYLTNRFAKRVMPTFTGSCPFK